MLLAQAPTVRVLASGGRRVKRRKQRRSCAERQCSGSHENTGARCENTAHDDSGLCLACSITKEDAQALIDHWYAPVDESCYQGIAAWWTRSDFAESVAERHILWYPETKAWAKREDEKRAAVGKDGKLKRSTQEKLCVGAPKLIAVAKALALHADPATGRDCKPTVAILARDSGQSVATVERAIRLLTLWQLRVVVREGRFYTPGERSVLHRYAEGSKRTHRGLAAVVALTPNPKAIPQFGVQDEGFEGVPLAVPALRASVGGARSRRTKYNTRPGENPRTSRHRRNGSSQAPRRTASKKGELLVEGSEDLAIEFQNHPLCPVWAARGMSYQSVARQMGKHVLEGRGLGFFVGAMEFWPYWMPHNPGNNRYGLLGHIFDLYAKFCREDERIKAITPTPLRNPVSGDLVAEKIATPRPAGQTEAFADILRSCHLPALDAEPVSPRPAPGVTLRPKAPSVTSEPDWLAAIPDPGPDPRYRAMRLPVGKETPEQRRERLDAQFAAREEPAPPRPTEEQLAARRAMVAALLGRGQRR